MFQWNALNVDDPTKRSVAWLITNPCTIERMQNQSNPSQLLLLLGSITVIRTDKQKRLLFQTLRVASRARIATKFWSTKQTWLFTSMTITVTPLSAMCVPIVKRLLKVPEVSEIIRANTTSLLELIGWHAFRLPLCLLFQSFQREKSSEGSRSWHARGVKYVANTMSILWEIFQK